MTAHCLEVEVLRQNFKSTGDTETVNDSFHSGDTKKTVIEESFSSPMKRVTVIHQLAHKSIFTNKYEINYQMPHIHALALGSSCLPELFRERHLNRAK